MVQVWRAYILPGGSELNHQECFEFCVDKNIIGVGWRVTDSFSWEPLSWRDYDNRARQSGEDPSRDNALHRLRNMEQHDLVWIRSPKPYQYYICRIVGPWDYRDAQGYRKADIVNVRAVEMVKIDPERVPLDINLRFKGGATIEPIRNQEQVDATVNLWKMSHLER